MLKEPKQVPKEPKVDTFQKYSQYFAYGISCINMDAPEEYFSSLYKFLPGVYLS